MRLDAEAAGIVTVNIEAPEKKSLPALLAPSLRMAILKLDRFKNAGEKAARALRALGSLLRAAKARHGDIEVSLELGVEPGVADTGDRRAEAVAAELGEGRGVTPDLGCGPLVAGGSACAEELVE